MAKKRSRPLRIPASFQIFGHTVDVVWVTPLLDDDGNELFGDWNADDLKVELDAMTIGTTAEGEAFAHELIECLNQQCELGITDHTKIELAGRGLHQILTTMYFPRKKKESKE